LFSPNYKPLWLEWESHQFLDTVMLFFSLVKHFGDEFVLASLPAPYSLFSMLNIKVVTLLFL
jgi:hypothetical protein